MRAVAQRCLGGMLAGTEVDPPAALGNVLQRRKAAALMSTTAERLLARAAAAAPVIGLAGLDVHGDRRPRGHDGISHDSSETIANIVGADASSVHSRASALAVHASFRNHRYSVAGGSPARPSRPSLPDPRPAAGWPADAPASVSAGCRRCHRPLQQPENRKPGAQIR